MRQAHPSEPRMPAPVSPELAELQKAFAGEQEAWLRSADGKRALKLVTSFARNVGELGLERVLGSASHGGAQAVQDWLGRGPEKPLHMDTPLWLNVAELKPKLAAPLVAGTMQALAAGAKAMQVAGAGKRVARVSIPRPM